MHYSQSVNEYFLFVNRLEDGTISYLSIISLLSGYETIENLVTGKSMYRIARHCFNLSKYLYDSLRRLQYANGRDVVRFYHDSTFESVDIQGGIVTFNIMHDDGTYVGFAEVSFIRTIYLNKMKSKLMTIEFLIDSGGTYGTIA